jgi:hypothetical protein
MIYSICTNTISSCQLVLFSQTTVLLLIHDPKLFMFLLMEFIKTIYVTGMIVEGCKPHQNIYCNVLQPYALEALKQ